MKLTITVDIPDEQLRELFRRAMAPDVARDGHDRDEPPFVQQEARPKGEDGHEFYE
jgi:hypothetical protein